MCSGTVISSEEDLRGPIAGDHPPFIRVLAERVTVPRESGDTARVDGMATTTAATATPTTSPTSTSGGGGGDGRAGVDSSGASGGVGKQAAGDVDNLHTIVLVYVESVVSPIIVWTLLCARSRS